MRRGHVEHENTHARKALAALASTGPRSLKRGDVKMPAVQPRLPRASTGPRSLKRGDYTSTRRNTSRDSASTGPRSLKRGDRNRRRFQSVPRAASTGPRSLQRGDPCSALLVSYGVLCFNGAALTQARRFKTFRSLPPEKQASTGPRSLKRGDIFSLPAKCLLPLASTGPRSLKRGDKKSTIICKTKI